MYELKTYEINDSRAPRCFCNFWIIAFSYVWSYDSVPDFDFYYTGILRKNVYTICKKMNFEIQSPCKTNENSMLFKVVFNHKPFSLWLLFQEKMKECIPKLIHSLSMIYAYSTYYNTFSNMTVLFVKVGQRCSWSTKYRILVTLMCVLQITNQMITSCKRHITDSYTQSIWAQDPETILKKIDSCISLNEAYQRIYRETKESMLEKRFDFSEMRIFGNFNLFVQRLGHIRMVVDKIRTYSILKEITLEGE